MSYKLNDLVSIRKTRQQGVIVETLNNDRYAVSVGGLRVVCRGEDLEIAQPTSKPKGKETVAGSDFTFTPREKLLDKNDTLDLHGLTVAQACEKVEYAISNAALSGKSFIVIVHGIGSGRVKQGVERLLTSLTVVKQFKQDPINPGATYVYL
jgi:DNA mismatch repair protein MutS2